MKTNLKYTLVLLLIPALWADFVYPATLLIIAAAYLVNLFLTRDQELPVNPELQHDLLILGNRIEELVEQQDRLNSKVQDIDNRAGKTALALAQVKR